MLRSRNTSNERKGWKDFLSQVLSPSGESLTLFHGEVISICSICSVMLFQNSWISRERKHSPFFSRCKFHILFKRPPVWQIGLTESEERKPPSKLVPLDYSNYDIWKTPPVPKTSSNVIRKKSRYDVSEMFWRHRFKIVLVASTLSTFPLGISLKICIIFTIREFKAFSFFAKSSTRVCQCFLARQITISTVRSCQHLGDPLLGHSPWNFLPVCGSSNI